ncbi:hypothetical protein [Caulobacter sp. 17J65-9]|uniref:hypothetical protein n=1 Tax=Caulobacter sp. 17J65-9 TaxID=2709382 RepID=UPI0013CDD466|nr:hypothetical protein [Caulobacter sp. 17J65-9]NEX95279.1 hypothetical protein [Caulobacter sp. 17J65-9]
MRFYQFYGLNSENDVVSADDVLCRDDEVARDLIQERLERFPTVELWDAGRRVCRLEGGSGPAGFIL